MPSDQPTIRSVLHGASRRLAEAGCDSPQLDAELLLAHSLGQSRTWLHSHALDQLDRRVGDQFANLLARRERREPVAYILGHKAFFGLDFLVTPDVLVPRPETELLVETALAYINNHQSRTTSHEPFSGADIGTGSGCIAVALAKNVGQASLTAVDVAAGALQVARQNALRHGVTDRIRFVLGDLLQPLAGLFDMIVSNPPYVSEDEFGATAAEIQGYEPQRALLAGPEGLDLIRRLLAQARARLKPGGILLVEIGAGQGAATVDLARCYFPGSRISLRQDLAGLDRLLRVEMPDSAGRL